MTAITSALLMAKITEALDEARMGECMISASALAAIREALSTRPEAADEKAEFSLEPVTRIDQIHQGDYIVFDMRGEMLNVTAQEVKVTEQDGTEIIYNRKKNHYFNLGMYLDGKSYVKSLYVLRRAVLAARKADGKGGE